MNSPKLATATMTMTIAEASASSGVAPDALRYYERERIIGPISRDAAGHRRFTSSDIAWIGVVTCLRDAGLGISDLRVFAKILDAETAPADRMEFLRDRREALQARRDGLTRALSVLDDKIEYYGARRSFPASPV
ncbi:MerR family transcriptional regulator [Microbacterium sp. SZ1]|uniref:MerR family transcriptional regulator n=1 Tax=Microbacterium sp. SZ1 TaxID=1849736 RepID=UPI00211CE6F2|nr:MerR family transcriptional regulator [Microbacterium sp. SZ1]